MQLQILTFEDPKVLQCVAIRRKVFIEEQHVPEDREQDGLDPIARHYLFTQDGKPIGAARSRLEGKQIKIERFAFLPEARGSGRGAEAFQAVIDDCLAFYPALPIKIGAQAYLRGFYERLGFKGIGEPFVDAGIDHVWMTYTAHMN